MCGIGGRDVPLDCSGSSETGDVAVEEVGEAAGEALVDELGDAIEAVERSDAAMVSRMCDSVLRVSVVTQAIKPSLATEVCGCTRILITHLDSVECDTSLPLR